MRRYLRSCDVCGDRAEYNSLKGAKKSVYHHWPVCAKQKAAKEKYRSLSWDEKAWVVLLTVRGDVLDSILIDIGKLGNTNKRR